MKSRSFLTVLLLAFASSLMADVTATILGTATDKSAAAIPQVKVTATNIETGFQQSAITDARGEELSDRWQEALLLKRLAAQIWAQVGGDTPQGQLEPSVPVGGASPS